MVDSFLCVLEDSSHHCLGLVKVLHAMVDDRLMVDFLGEGEGIFWHRLYPL